MHFDLHRLVSIFQVLRGEHVGVSDHRLVERATLRENVASLATMGLLRVLDGSNTSIAPAVRAAKEALANLTALRFAAAVPRHLADQLAQELHIPMHRYLRRQSRAGSQ